MSQDSSEILQSITDAKSIAIITHAFPDTDAFASSVALREIIRKIHSQKPKNKVSRKKVDVFMDYQQLPQSLDIFFYKKEKYYKFINQPRPLKQYDLAIVLDCASKERMGKYQEIFEKAKSSINIDHHATNTRFAEKNVVMKVSSTCEALYYIFLHRQSLTVSTYVLSLLYSGIITDTNDLKNNADAKTTERAVSCFKQKLGIMLAKKLRANFFENNSPQKDELYAYAYNKKHRRYLADEKFCLIVLDNKIFKKTGASLEDAEGIVDEALHRKGLFASGIILEKEKGKAYVKLRSKDNLNISNLAKTFKGGGHETVAAFQYSGKVSSLVKDLSNEIEKFMIESKLQEEDKWPEFFD